MKLFVNALKNFLPRRSHAVHATPLFQISIEFNYSIISPQCPCNDLQQPPLNFIFPFDPSHTDGGVEGRGNEHNWKYSDVCSWTKQYVKFRKDETDGIPRANPKRMQANRKSGTPSCIPDENLLFGLGVRRTTCRAANFRGRLMAPLCKTWCNYTQLLELSFSSPRPTPLPPSLLLFSSSSVPLPSPLPLYSPLSLAPPFSKDPL